MATVKGILGQAAPGAGVDSDLYTCPASKNATVKVISANRGAIATVRIWVAINGATTSNEQYLVYDFTLAANEPKTTTAFMVGDTDVVRVRASTANVSFTCSGIEEDN